MIDRQHPVARSHEWAVRSPPVEVGARHPAVQEQDRWPVASGVAKEQLASAGDVDGTRRGEGHGRRGWGGGIREPGHRPACYVRRAVTPRDGFRAWAAMAVLIASDVGKDIAGEPLLRGARSSSSAATG